MSTLSDPQPGRLRGAVTWGRGNSKMPPEQRARANAFWRDRIARAERRDRVYGAPKST